MVPLAHAGHYLTWVLYLPPVLVVICSIAWTKLSERREKKAPAPDSRR
ncbi:MAG TPA: hypothetical protein VF259_05205 [Solirubrobacterales bacterium]